MRILDGGGALGHLEEEARVPSLNHTFSVVGHSASGTVLCLVQYQQCHSRELEEADEDLLQGPEPRKGINTYL